MNTIATYINYIITLKNKATFTVKTIETYLDVLKVEGNSEWIDRGYIALQFIESIKPIYVEPIDEEPRAIFLRAKVEHNRYGTTVSYIVELSSDDDFPKGYSIFSTRIDKLIEEGYILTIIKEKKRERNI